MILSFCGMTFPHLQMRAHHSHVKNRPCNVDSRTKSSLIFGLILTKWAQKTSYSKRWGHTVNTGGTLVAPWNPYAILWPSLSRVITPKVVVLSVRESYIPQNGRKIEVFKIYFKHCPSQIGGLHLLIDAPNDFCKVVLECKKHLFTGYLEHQGSRMCDRFDV